MRHLPCEGKAKMKRAVAYVRVSTDRQTVENQITRLTEIANARGWQIVNIFSDAGSSGAKGRKDRPGLDELLKQAQRHRFDIVMAWAIDRLGRSLVDLLATIQHLEACGVDLFLDQQAIDTTTPAGKLMFQVCGAFGEFERSLIRQRIHAGLKRAVANGKTLGRPLNNPEALDKARELLGEGLGINKVARQVGLSNTTVARLKAEKSSPPSGPDCPAALPKSGSLRRGDQETIQRDATALPNGLKNGSLIAVSDIDRIFSDSRIKKLAEALKLEAYDPRFAQSIRQDVRLFIEAKGRLNNPKLREAISRLHRLTARAEGNDQAARRLANAIAAMPSDVWDWLARCNPEARDIPTAAQILSTETRASAIQQLRHILSYGAFITTGRNRPAGKHSLSFEPLLWVPKIESNRPQSDAEREFVRNLGLTHTNAAGKAPPYKVNFQSRGPFSQFVHECFELVGAPSGSVTRLINEFGQARHAEANCKVERREDAGAHLERDEWFRQGTL
jgi:DNA invertase Pin-like site-specific DNA recombinase